MQKIMFNDDASLTTGTIEGWKTNTRRLISNKYPIENIYPLGNFLRPVKHCYHRIYGQWGRFKGIEDYLHGHEFTPKYKVGEIVAIAQSYKDIHEEMMAGDFGDSKYDSFRNAVVHNTAGWENKMFVKAEYMPHQIEILSVRAERLQDISDQDCIKEGIREVESICSDYSIAYENGLKINSRKGTMIIQYDSPREAFAALIDKVGRKGDWARNPWCWVYEYKLVK